MNTGPHWKLETENWRFEIRFPLKAAVDAGISSQFQIRIFQFPMRLNPAATQLT